MAFDRTPSQPELDPETVAALRTALAKSASQGTHVADLHDLLCRAAGDARSKGIRAEHLLLMLKDIWYALPEVMHAPSSDVENPLLRELISRCIQEYYSI